jgi:hypothetical protein
MPSFSCHVYSLEVQHIVCLERRTEGGERRLKVTLACFVTSNTQAERQKFYVIVFPQSSLVFGDKIQCVSFWYNLSLQWTELKDAR